MNTAKGVQKGRPITYTAYKEVEFMRRRPFSRTKSTLRISLLLVVALFTLPFAGVLVGAPADLSVWETYTFYFGVLTELPAIEEYMSGITGMDLGPEREAFLADPRGALESAGIVLDPEVWTIIALDTVRGLEAGVFGVSPLRDAADRFAKPHCIGIVKENVAMAIQLASDDPFEGVAESTVDVFFDLVFGIENELVERLDAAMELLNGKDPRSDDRVEGRRELDKWLEREAGIAIDRLQNRVVEIDFEDANGYAAEHEVEPPYTISEAAGGPSMCSEAVGFIYPDVGILLLQANL